MHQLRIFVGTMLCEKSQSISDHPVESGGRLEWRRQRLIAERHKDIGVGQRAWFCWLATSNHCQQEQRGSEPASNVQTLLHWEPHLDAMNMTPSDAARSWEVNPRTRRVQASRRCGYRRLTSATDAAMSVSSTLISRSDRRLKYKQLLPILCFPSLARRSACSGLPATR